MEVLAWSEVRIFRILGDVNLQRGELLRASHEVVKTLFLPEPSLLSQRTIDLSRGELLPRHALALDFGIAKQTR
jgi:hypothetical protein